MTKTELNTQIKIARQYRKTLPKHLRGSGFGSVFNGGATGWRNTLRDPQHFEPGVLLIGADKSVHQATGGSRQTGAHGYQQIQQGAQA